MAVSSTAATTSTSLYAQSLDQNDFLKLMVAQLSAQDPLNPVKDTDFAAQMAQFSALQQNQAMQQNMATIQAAGLLGRQVTVKNPQGQSVTGEVTSVTLDAGTPKILINGLAYELNQIVSITPIPLQTNNNNTSNTTQVASKSPVQSNVL